VLLVAAFLLGSRDRGGETDRGLFLFTIAGGLVLVTWIMLGVYQHPSWGYLRYAYLGATPVIIWFVYCFFEPVYWSLQVLLWGVVAIILLYFLGYVFWPFWIVGFILARFSAKEGAQL